MAHIVFLCPHGGAKSVIAAHYFNAAGLPYTAVALATDDPYDEVPAPVAELLGITGFRPRRVENADLDGAARVIAIDCDVARAERWQDVPKVSEDLAGAVAAIRRHVEVLVAELRVAPAPIAPDPPTLAAFTGYFLGLGTFGFGGPIALAGAMQRDLVEERRWVTGDEYLKGLALAQLAPGPLAAQLAIYLGWARGGVWGATLVGLAFVLPSFAMVLALSFAYVRFGRLEWMQAAFYGIGAAVIAIILRSAIKLVKLTLGRDRLLWAVFALNAVATAVLEAEVVRLILAGGLIMLAARWRWTPAPLLSLVPIFWFFTKAGAVVFGSGLAIVPFLYGGVVREHGWLTEQQFVDAVAIAMITPGPVVITVAFIGYLADGLGGAAAASLGVFFPCWLFVVLPAPYYARFADDPRLKSFVSGVTAGATGAIAGATYVLARRAIVDVPTILIFAATLVCLIWMKRVPEPVVITLVGAGTVLFHAFA